MYLRRNETNFRVLSKTTAQGSVPCVKKDRPAQLKREWSLAASLSPSQRELSQHLKYIVRDRISEFESSHPSHGVGGPVEPIRRCASGWENHRCRPLLLRCATRYLLRPSGLVLVFFVRDHRGRS